MNIGVHENHLIVTMVLAFVLLAIREPGARLACVFCALSFNINLILFYGVRGETPVNAALAKLASIVVPLINTACLGVCLCATLRRSLPHARVRR